MMSLGQKFLALGVILGMDVVAFLLAPLFGVIALAASLPLALVILKR